MLVYKYLIYLYWKMKQYFKKRKFCFYSLEYQAALKKQTELMNSALEEVSHYCEFNNWLNEIHQFCRKWNDKSVKEFRGAQAYAIEVSHESWIF